MFPGTRHNVRTLEGKAELWSDDDGISWLSFAPGAEISGEDAQEIIRLSSLTYTGEEMFRAIIDLRSEPTISNEARAFAAGDGPSQYFERLALVADSVAMKLVGNFFIQFHKPRIPTRIFTTTEEAKKWLMEDRAVGS